MSSLFQIELKLSILTNFYFFFKFLSKNCKIVYDQTVKLFIKLQSNNLNAKYSSLFLNNFTKITSFWVFSYRVKKVVDYLIKSISVISQYSFYQYLSNFTEEM